MADVDVVSGEGEDWGGLLDLRSFVGVPTCTLNSLTRAEGEGLGFLSSDPSGVRLFLLEPDRDHPRRGVSGHPRSGVGGY